MICAVLQQLQLMLKRLNWHIWRQLSLGAHSLRGNLGAVLTHLVRGLIITRTGLPPDILLNQPPPDSIELRDTAWSWPVPVRSTTATGAAACNFANSDTHVRHACAQTSSADACTPCMCSDQQSCNNCLLRFRHSQHLLVTPAH